MSTAIEKYPANKEVLFSKCYTDAPQTVSAKAGCNSFPNGRFQRQNSVETTNWEVPAPKWQILHKWEVPAPKCCKQHIADNEHASKQRDQRREVPKEFLTHDRSRWKRSQKVSNYFRVLVSNYFQQKGDQTLGYLGCFFIGKKSQLPLTRDARQSSNRWFATVPCSSTRTGCGLKQGMVGRGIGLGMFCWRANLEQGKPPPHASTQLGADAGSGGKKSKKKVWADLHILGMPEWIVGSCVADHQLAGVLLAGCILTLQDATTPWAVVISHVLHRCSYCYCSIPVFPASVSMLGSLLFSAAFGAS